jgi:hypothetical protein
MAVPVTAGPDDRGPAAGGCHYVTTLRDFKLDGSIGARWNVATRTLAYARPNAAGSYEVFLSDVDGGHERALTWPEWGDHQHQFPVDWTASGT